MDVFLVGTSALHLRLRYQAAHRRDVRAFAVRLADALSHAGLTGELRRPIPEYPQEGVYSVAGNDRAVAVLYAARELIDAGSTRRLSAVHGLDQLPSHNISGGSPFTLNVRHSPDLLAAMPILETAFLSGWESPLVQAEIMISPFVASGWTHMGTREEQMARARAALTENASDVHHAFAEVLTGFNCRWGPSLSRPPNGVSGTTYVQRRDLHPKRVIDAHGLQILTAHHLERATCLTNWRTTQIGDRYLVEARDLDPWYAHDEPDADVLAQARSDFGGMIITETELRALYKAEYEARVREDQERRTRGETP